MELANFDNIVLFKDTVSLYQNLTQDEEYGEVDGIGHSGDHDGIGVGKASGRTFNKRGDGEGFSGLVDHYLFDRGNTCGGADGWGFYTSNKFHINKEEEEAWKKILSDRKS